VLHFFFGGLAGEAEHDAVLQVLLFVRYEIDGTDLGPDDIAGSVAGCPANKHHGVIALLGDNMGKAEGVGAEVGLPRLGESAHEHHRHGKEAGGLVEIVQDANIKKFICHKHCSILDATTKITKREAKPREHEEKQIKG